ncbi:Hypothetical protein R9X50_00216000 [Acrodontium crateriforme]|uniref:C2H2-type domain-containing protein n=1 Tax=Acrodontium crateriforme TaxID=150365 RepID=A0AAQ3M1R5_9PEZI|nr:Hypothetical protein R9X50_00216000 [Acrodontium crateriforme]
MSTSIDSMAPGAPPDSRLKLPTKASETAGRTVHEERHLDYEVDDTTDSKPKKKRRVTQSSVKKYECPADDCGKSYSRAEHLYRHQLNHAPKQIYRCDHPGCDRYFVRADLCARHKERHTAKGSHLQRKDAFLKDQTTQNASRNPISPPAVSDSASHASQTGYNSRDGEQNSSSNAMAAMAIQPSSSDQGQQRSNSMPGLVSTLSNSSISVDSAIGISGHSMYHNYDNGPSNQTLPPTLGSESPQTSRDSWLYGKNAFEPIKDGAKGNTMQELPRQQYNSLPYGTSQIHQQQTTNFTSPVIYQMPPPISSYGYSPEYGSNNNTTMPAVSPPAISAADQRHVPNSRPNSLADVNMIEQLASGYSMPVFGHESFDRPPPVLMDDSFLNSLFGESILSGIETASLKPESPLDNTTDGTIMPMPGLDGINSEILTSNRGRDGATGINLLDIGIRESLISATMQHRLIRLVRRWSDIEENPGRKTKEEILRGNIDDQNHALSLTMLRTYLTSYWVHIHCQMPILHRPTFNPETCPELLLMAMMCLGATCLERTHSYELTRDSAELAFFIAYHVRWEVFKDAEFRPTAKLWTFQTMLLLELFEKMYSTRSLHERAHIHHATTLTVMRRGSSLIGRNAAEYSSGDDPTRTPPGPQGSINTSGQNTPDAFWNRWITAEATRRVAFAAFIIDSTHATLFGHSAVMSPHELRLPLPCDEALWSATSSAEVQRVEASLAANGFIPTTFLDGLKKTLHGVSVRTNTFGRVILMSGLLNVTYHMNQRDLQVSSLGAAGTLGNQIKWRSPLNRAFDFWRRDFDHSISKNEHWLQICNHKSIDSDRSGRKDHVFESRTCLHSLAHMAMHVEITDCMVFAGSEYVLGRMVMDTDRAAMRRRMREQWAPSARARDATFYALRFLCEVLIPEEELTSKRTHPNPLPTFTYSSRDDYLLNRPWTLYFALLIVWSYGYALDGPLVESNYRLHTRESQIHDMQHFLIRMGGVASPDDLENLKDRNACLGLMLLLRESFQQPRWELLQEANDVLGSCIDLLVRRKNDVYEKNLDAIR